MIRRAAFLPCLPVLALVAALPLHAQEPAPRPEALPPDLDAYVARVMETFDVPGLAVAVVEDGRVVLARGYGVRELGRPDPVDAHTRFGIASNTKAFTATALALLVEEGLLEWDAPVIRYLPWFRMSDPYVTEQMTVRDLLVHRSGLGLGAGDLLQWPPSTYTTEEIVRRLAHVPLATSFRSAYAYDNILYLVAGELVEAVSGRSWEEFVASRVLTPVGMTDSRIGGASVLAGGNVALTHAKVDGVLRRVEPDASENGNAAGGINASATDMAKWMIVQLDSGRVAGAERLFAPATTVQLWSLVTPIPIREPAPELAPARMNFSGYGLGFFVRDYRGRKMVTHTGGLAGYVSRLTLIPDLKLGVAVLTNAEEGGAFNAITNHVVDAFLGAPRHDWLEAYRAVGAQRDSAIAAEDRAAAAGRDSASGPSLPLPEYAGTYRDPWYGDVGIGLERGRLVIRFSHSPQLVGDLEHWQYDTFVARWRDRSLRADAFVTFDLDPLGAVREVRMRPVSASTDFSYDFQDLRLVPAGGG